LLGLEQSTHIVGRDRHEFSYTRPAPRASPHT
jgi:hypothetical protein